MPARSFGASAGHTQEALAAMAPRAWLAPPAESQCAQKPCMGSFRELFSAELTYKQNEDVPGFHALSLGVGTCEGVAWQVQWLDSHRTGSSVGAT